MRRTQSNLPKMTIDTIFHDSEGFHSHLLTISVAITIIMSVVQEEAEEDSLLVRVEQVEAENYSIEVRSYNFDDFTGSRTETFKPLCIGNSFMYFFKIDQGNI